ncbi:hypothetical protein KM043_014412 [Ampulex compressa]|nr:hypothetical protein KM043_014412 [Ampulex compressa]
MARYILFALLVACLVYCYQANPMPQDNQHGSDLDNLEEKVKNAWNSAKSTFEKDVGDLLNNPAVKSAIDSAKELIDKTSESVRQGVQNIGEKINQ